jgi:uncharacterized protein YbdZ (MbtH family)
VPFAGWSELLTASGRERIKDISEKNWTDMLPKSLIEAMQEREAS